MNRRQFNSFVVSPVAAVTAFAGCESLVSQPHKIAMPPARLEWRHDECAGTPCLEHWSLWEVEGMDTFIRSVATLWTYDHLTWDCTVNHHFRRWQGGKDEKAALAKANEWIAEVYRHYWRGVTALQLA